MKWSLIMISLLFLPYFGIAQMKTISGIITNQDNQPLTNVKIFCYNDSLLGYTDSVGQFKVSIPVNVEIVSFSKSGYAIASSKTKSKLVINLKLDLESVYELSFEDLIMANVVTVSLKEQNISYAPGVITILTQKDIKRLGARTLKEALTMIPGFSLMQNDDEQILGVRGIFATTNQKILVMRDGYPLNESNLDIPQTEYSISIENIKKIEIIRGPGASIYGNSALAAVINIITQDSENTYVKSGVGNYGQFDFDAYSYNKLKNNGSILIFGRYSTNEGERFPVDFKPGITLLPGTYTTNRYPNNFDVGFRYQVKDITVSGATQHHEYKTYWTSQGFYTNVDSLFHQPGLLSDNGYLNIKYEPEISENLNLHFVHYFGNGRLVNYRLLSAIDSVKYLNGRMQANEWNTSKFGANYYGLWNFSKKGQMLAGVSYEIRNYLDSWVASNTIDSSQMVFSSEPFFPKGREIRGSIYLQTQFQLFKWLVFDLGGRDDIAQNYNSSFNP